MTKAELIQKIGFNTLTDLRAELERDVKFRQLISAEDILLAVEFLIKIEKK